MQIIYPMKYHVYHWAISFYIGQYFFSRTIASIDASAPTTQPQKRSLDLCHLYVCMQASQFQAHVAFTRNIIGASYLVFWLVRDKKY